MECLQQDASSEIALDSSRTLIYIMYGIILALAIAAELGCVTWFALWPIREALELLDHHFTLRSAWDLYSIDGSNLDVLAVRLLRLQECCCSLLPRPPTRSAARTPPSLPRITGHMAAHPAAAGVAVAST